MIPLIAMLAKAGIGSAGAGAGAGAGGLAKLLEGGGAMAKPEIQGTGGGGGGKGKSSKKGAQNAPPVKDMSQPASMDDFMQAMTQYRTQTGRLGQNSKGSPVAIKDASQPQQLPMMSGPKQRQAAAPKQNVGSKQISQYLEALLGGGRL